VNSPFAAESGYSYLTIDPALHTGGVTGSISVTPTIFSDT